VNRSEYYQIIEKLRCGWEDGKPTIVMALPVGTVELDESLLFDLRSVARKQFGFATALVLEDDLEDGPRFIFHKPDLRMSDFAILGAFVINSMPEAGQSSGSSVEVPRTSEGGRWDWCRERLERGNERG